MTETKRRARRLLGLLPFSYRGTLLTEAKRIRARRHAVRIKAREARRKVDAEVENLKHRQKLCDKEREAIGKLIDTFTSVTVQHPAMDRDRGRHYSMKIDILPEYAMCMSGMRHAGEFEMLAQEMGYRVKYEVERIFRTLDFKRLDEYPRLPRPPAYRH